MHGFCLSRLGCLKWVFSIVCGHNFSFLLNFQESFSHHANDAKNKANNAMKHDPKPLMHSVIISPLGVCTLFPWSVDIRQKNFTSGMKINAPTDICKRSASISTEKMKIFFGSELRFLFVVCWCKLFFLRVWGNFRRLGITPVALNTRSPWIVPIFDSKWNTRRQSPTDWQTASTMHYKIKIKTNGDYVCLLNLMK